MSLVTNQTFKFKLKSHFIAGRAFFSYASRVLEHFLLSFFEDQNLRAPEDMLPTKLHTIRQTSGGKLLTVLTTTPPLESKIVETSSMMEEVLYAGPRLQYLRKVMLKISKCFYQNDRKGAVYFPDFDCLRP